MQQDFGLHDNPDVMLPPTMTLHMGGVGGGGVGVCVVVAVHFAWKVNARGLHGVEIRSTGRETRIGLGGIECLVEMSTIGFCSILT